jgi:putative membrane protein
MRAGPVSGAISFLTAPAAAFALHALALLMWHVPAAYDAAVRSESLHAIEHLTFLGTALLFWWVVLSPSAHGGLNYALRFPYLLGMTLVGTAIGAVLTFASSSLYHAYLASAPTRGMTPLEDQQIAGLIMWIPGGVAYLIAAAGLFLQWMRVEGEREHRGVIAVRAQ